MVASKGEVAVLQPQPNQDQYPVRTAKGVNGQILYFPHKIVIQRKGLGGFLTQGLKGDKDIPIASITSVQLKKAGTITNGYIQFGLKGGIESKAGLFKAVEDENTVMFSARQEREFLEMKDLINSRICELQSPPQEPASSGIGDLERLANLLEKGLITREDFDAAKRRILGQL